MMKNKHAVLSLFVGVIVGLVCYSYMEIKRRGSDDYAIDMLREGNCEFLMFPDGSWLKTLIFDAGSICHGMSRGAVYMLDSKGRKIKISGGYIKPKRFTYEMITSVVSECENVDEALSDNRWKYLFPWLHSLPFQLAMP